MISPRYISWEETDEACRAVSDAVRADRMPDCILGITRGGIIPARIIADHLHISRDLFYIDAKLYDGVGKRLDKPYIEEINLAPLAGKYVLIVDDIWDSGTTMKAVNDYIEPDPRPADIYPEVYTKAATLYVREDEAHEIDFFHGIALQNEWLVFRWEEEEFKNSFDQKKL